MGDLYKNEQMSVLAIDPGRDKCGLAIVDYNLQVLYKKIISSREIKAYLTELTNIYNIRNIIIGNGTFSREILADIKKVTDIPVETIDEAYTTREAEIRYRKEKAGFWQWCLFFVDWKPNIPLDDYVAVILAEHYFKKGQVDNNSR